jgi:hypothetical protein
VIRIELVVYEALEEIMPGSIVGAYNDLTMVLESPAHRSHFLQALSRRCGFEVTESVLQEHRQPARLINYLQSIGPSSGRTIYSRYGNPPLRDIVVLPTLAAFQRCRKLNGAGGLRLVPRVRASTAGHWLADLGESGPGVRCVVGYCLSTWYAVMLAIASGASRVILLDPVPHESICRSVPEALGVPHELTDSAIKAIGTDLGRALLAEDSARVAEMAAHLVRVSSAAMETYFRSKFSSVSSANIEGLIEAWRLSVAHGIYCIDAAYSVRTPVALPTDVWLTTDMDEASLARNFRNLTIHRHTRQHLDVGGMVREALRAVDDS